MRKAGNEQVSQLVINALKKNKAGQRSRATSVLSEVGCSGKTLLKRHSRKKSEQTVEKTMLPVGGAAFRWGE